MLEGKPGAARKWLALGILAVLAGIAWFTLEPGKIRLVVSILLGSFALRIVLTDPGSRYDGEQG